MIFGALGGLLVAVAVTLITGKLQLAKNRIVYGTPARMIALAGLLPLAGLVIHVLTTGRTVNQPGGIGMFLGALAASVLLMYALGWPMGEPPRQ